MSGTDPRALVILLALAAIIPLLCWWDVRVSRRARREMEAHVLSALEIAKSAREFDEQRLRKWLESRLQSQWLIDPREYPSLSRRDMDEIAAEVWSHRTSPLLIAEAERITREAAS